MNDKHTTFFKAAFASSHRGRNHKVSPRICEPLRSTFDARLFSIPFDGESSREKYIPESPIRVHGSRSLPSEVNGGLQRKYPRHPHRRTASQPA